MVRCAACTMLGASGDAWPPPSVIGAAEVSLARDTIRDRELRALAPFDANAAVPRL